MNYSTYVKQEYSVKHELLLTPAQDPNDFTPASYVEVKRKSIPNKYILHDKGHLELGPLGLLLYICNP